MLLFTLTIHFNSGQPSTAIPKDIPIRYTTGPTETKGFSQPKSNDT